VQILLFSATIPPNLHRTIGKHMSDFQSVDLVGNERNQTSKT